VAVNIFASGCSNGGSFTLSTISCITEPCGNPGQFRACSGTCNQTAPQLCAPTLIGYMLSASIPALGE
jgi:hypothetical protein